MRSFAILIGAVLCSGCLSAAGQVVMMPVHAVSFTADKLTTSQAEADRNLGRKTRKEQERQGREARREAKAEQKRQREAERDAN